MWKRKGFKYIATRIVEEDDFYMVQEAELSFFEYWRIRLTQGKKKLQDMAEND